jgi:hypothetical protein
MPPTADPGLGARLIAPDRGGHTRLPSDPDEFRIQSNATWVVLSIVLVLGIAAGVAAFLMT